MDETYFSAHRYLAAHNVLCLSTCVDDIPWVSPVFYSLVNSRIVFLSASHTRHCKNIALNPKISASIQQDYKDWSDIKGIQLEGTVSCVQGDDTQAVVKAYSEKFPITGDSAPREIRDALDKISWFSLTVSRLYYIDNSKGLGHRTKLDPARLFSI